MVFFFEVLCESIANFQYLKESKCLHRRKTLSCPIKLKLHAKSMYYSIDDHKI